MAVNPRSTQLFLSFIGDTTQHTVLTVPTNYTIIVKEIRAFITTGTPASSTLQLLAVRSPDNLWFPLVNANLSQGTVMALTSWTVLPQNWRVMVTCGGGTVSVSASGTLLQGVGTVPASVETLPAPPIITAPVPPLAA